MKVGLVGLPGSGKSTLFRVLTGQQRAASATADGIATVHVPDRRLDRIAAICKPERVVYPELTVLDLLAVKGRQAPDGELHLVKVAGDADAFAIVVQCFGDLDHAGMPLDPRSDLETVLLEMSLTDLSIVEKRIERIRGKGSKREIHETWELHLLERVQRHLGAGGRARQMQLADDELKHLGGFALLTLKPLLVVSNLGEQALGSEASCPAQHGAQEAGLAGFALCGELAEEMCALPDEEQREFAQAYGFTEPFREALIRALFGLLSSVTFYTVNDHEAHAWTAPAGTRAPQAAGRVHTDMERGFIRAEVVPFGVLDRLGSMDEVRRQKLLRVEGSGYQVQDGDILQIRFSR